MTSSAGPLTRARRAAGRWRARRSAPLVTVVVPVYQAEAYLDECLRSVLAQTHERLQVVVVDDGSTDGSRAVYERHAAVDDRIEVVRQENRGLGVARNVGIAQARGDYLTFLDADDTLPPKAYRTMVATLEESGSDFAVGAVLRVASGRRSTPAWIAEVHAAERRGITIDDYPRAVMDVIACNRMFRTSAWARLGLTFPEGVAYEDHVPMMAAYVRGRFDILRETTYHWRIREDRTSIGQQKHSVANLRDRLEAKRGARELLEAEASATVLDAWQARVLDMDLRLFIDEVPGVDQEYWDVLRTGVRDQVDRATPAAWADVRVEQRVRAWLVANDHRPELEALLRAGASGAEVVPARVVGDRVMASVDLPEAARPPAALLEVGPRELALQVSVRSVAVEGDELVLVLDPRVGPLRDGLEDAELLAVLRDPTGRTVTVPAGPAGPPARSQWSLPVRGPRRPDLRELRLPAGALPSPAATWQLEVDYTVGALHLRGPITSRDPDGSAGRPPTLVAHGRELATRWHKRSGFAVEVREIPPGEHGSLGGGAPASRPLLVVDDIELSATGLELRGSWLGELPAGPTPFVLEADAQPPLVVAHEVDRGRATVSLTWDEAPGLGLWRFRPAVPGGALWVAPGLLARLPMVVPAGGVRLAAIRDADDAPALRVVLNRS